MSERKALFISHASPDDNEFTIWLGAKLVAAGYEVWADVLRLNGGDDWQRKLEWAIRDRALKVLLVANQTSVAKQGVRNEIQIATDVGKKISDPTFIIPLRLGPFDAPFLIAHAQYIDFSRGWAAGLHELLAELETEHKIPRDGEASTTPWLALQSIHGKHLAEKPERLISNWLRVRRLPENVFFYGKDELRSSGIELSFPKVGFREGFLTCEDCRLAPSTSRPISEFLNADWSEMGVSVVDARRMYADLMNQALESFLKDRGLLVYEMANGRPARFFGSNLPDTQLPFRWPQDRGSRQLRGFSAKRKVHWHFGISPLYRGTPIRHVRIKSRLVFSEDGLTPLSSKSRMHRLRRSFAKSWRNARWRDMLLAFLFWLSGGESILSVPVGLEQALLIELPTVSYTSPVGILEDTSARQADADDPDIDVIDDEDLEDEEQESLP
jgi:hypothetical protein